MLCFDMRQSLGNHHSESSRPILAEFDQVELARKNISTYMMQQNKNKHSQHLLRLQIFLPSPVYPGKQVHLMSWTVVSQVANGAQLKTRHAFRQDPVWQTSLCLQSSFRRHSFSPSAAKFPHFITGCSQKWNKNSNLSTYSALAIIAIN